MITKGDIMKEILSVILAASMIMASVVCIGIFASASYKGDTNGDGMTDNKDVVSLFRYVSGGSKTEDESVYDFNNDGSVDNKDVVALFRDVSVDDPSDVHYDFLLYTNGAGGAVDTTTKKFSGKDFGIPEYTEKVGMENKKITLFGEECEMAYIHTLDYGIFDERYDQYVTRKGSVTIGERTGRIASFTNNPDKKENDFTPPVNAYSSRREFIDYASSVLLEYTGVSTDDCDVFIHTSKIKTTYKYTQAELKRDFVNFIDQDPDFTAEYRITFRKKLGRIYRADSIEVVIRSDGEIRSVKSRICDEAFEPFIDVKISKNSLRKSVLDKYYHAIGCDITSEGVMLYAIPYGDELWVMAEIHYEYEESGYVFGSVVEYITKITDGTDEIVETELVVTETGPYDPVSDTGEEDSVYCSEDV